jgi:hypothetical protein
MNDTSNHVNGFLKKMCIRNGTLDFIDIHKEFSKQGSAIKPLFDTNDVSGVGLIVISLRLRFLSCCGVTGNSLFPGSAVKYLKNIWHSFSSPQLLMCTPLTSFVSNKGFIALPCLLNSLWISMKSNVP